MDETSGTVPSKLADAGTFRAYDLDLKSVDPLQWLGYPAALTATEESTGLNESVIAGNAVIAGQRVELAEFHFGFFGGSMGEVAGERLARAIDRAARRKVPFVLHTSTGGARMQEGMVALAQMPKVAAARRGLTATRTPFIAVLGHPTTGGVLAGLAASADITIAESGATIGFAGPRIAAAVTGTGVSGSHTAETALEHGLVDCVVDPESAPLLVGRLLDMLAADSPISSSPPEVIVEPLDESFAGWMAVEAARSPGRATAVQMLAWLDRGNFELRGDRAGSDDRAVVVALERIAGRKAIVIATNRDVPPSAAGFRKAIRGLDVAARLGIPVLTLIDTRGADPSSASENTGVAWAIAATFDKMLEIDVPTVAVVTGEGGSGGALALATADVVLAFESSIFSVIGPELAAEILWKDPSRASEAAASLRLTSHDLLRLGIADALLPEPLEPTAIANSFAYHLGRLEDGEQLRAPSARLRRWRGHANT